MFRRSHPSAQPGDERKDLFGPVADLMVGVIFIFIILLMGLALHLQPEDYQRLQDQNERLKGFVRYVRDHRIGALFARIASANETRAEMLEDMRRRLKVFGIEVTIDPTNGTPQAPRRGALPGRPGGPDAPRRRDHPQARRGLGADAALL